MHISGRRCLVMRSKKLIKMKSSKVRQKVIQILRYLDRARRVAQDDFNQSSNEWCGEVSGSKISVGMFTYGFSKKSVKAWGEGTQLQIGKFCSIADKVTFFLGGNHRADWITTFPFGHTAIETFGNQKFEGHPNSNGNITIGNDVWIGSGATIMSGVTVGNGAVIAANSHVVRNVGPYEIWGGNPARLIKIRFDSETVQKLEEICWWDFPVREILSFIPSLSTYPNENTLKLLKLTREGKNQGSV
jgi:chloramphenicol O-acetyltransferase type B